MKNQKLRILPAIAAAVFLFLPASASIVTSYDFTIDNTNQSPTALATATDTSAPWSGNFMGNVVSGAFRDTANSLLEETITGALTTNRYVSFTLTPAEAINFTSFEVTLGGYNAAGSTDYNVGLAVFSSLTGFANDTEALGNDSLFLAAGSGIIDKGSPLNIDLTGFAALQNTTSEVEFRVYMTDDRAADNSVFNVRVRDISVEAVAVPEPSTVALGMGLFTLALAIVRRRFKQ